jgi:signal transduction histidine kinase
VSLGLLALLLDLHGAGAAVVATAMVALAVLPVWSRVRGVAEAWVYGARRDPATAVVAVGEALNTAEPGQVGAVLEQAVARAAGVGSVRIAAVAGDEGAAVFDLVHESHQVGVMIVEPVAGERRIPRAAIDVLSGLAPVVAAAVHASAATEELAAARTRLVTAREEERRRLRRDLHDGLGPALAGITMEIQAARAVVDVDPGRADEMLGAAETWSRAAIDEIRRVVYELRPPSLDQFGLVGALQQQATRLGLTVNGRRDSAAPWPTLPAAAEVAAYLVVVESMTNITRHAGTDRCEVNLNSTESEITVEIVDDGVGLPKHVVQGVGISSMRERAAELGGTCALERRVSGGTRVTLRLPIGVAW